MLCLFGLMTACNGGAFDAFSGKKGRDNRSGSGDGKNGGNPALGDQDGSGRTKSQLEQACDRRVAAGEVIRVVGNSQRVDLTVGEVNVIMVVGNGQTVDLELETDQGSIDKLCVLVVGNSHHFRLVSNIDISMVFYRDAGNNNDSEIEIASSGRVGEFEVRHVGNAGKLVIAGEGDYKCPASPIVVGNSMDMSCK
jgi:hypothetical protein